jgi:hypothetical protein
MAEDGKDDVEEWWGSSAIISKLLLLKMRINVAKCKSWFYL